MKRAKDAMYERSDGKTAEIAPVKVKGPVRLPTKRLVVTTRRTPNGEGTKTWDRYEMRVYKRLIDMVCDSSTVKEIAGRIDIPYGVDVEGTLTPLIPISSILFLVSGVCTDWTNPGLGLVSIHRCRLFGMVPRFPRKE